MHWMTGSKKPMGAWTGWRPCRPVPRQIKAAYEVAEYVMKLRAAVTGLAGDRSASQLSEAVGVETAQLVEDLRQTGAMTTRIRGSVPPF